MSPTAARFGVVAAMVGAAIAFAWASAATRSVAAAPPVAPRLAPAPEEFASSGACRSCHPGEHASWHRSFHRTMTQAATASTVRAPDAELSLDGAPYQIRRQGDDVWVTLPSLPPSFTPDPRAPGAPRRLELATGSHHYQAYWTAGGVPGSLEIFPWVYVFREARWMPRRDVFLQPPDRAASALCWASGCIQCHATAGRPGRDTSGAFDSDVAELGIACEACHGPGAEHVRRYRDPVARYRAYAGGEPGNPDGSIVNPARLPADRASMICGRCHAFTLPKDEDEWWRRGDTRVFRPGDDLSLTRILIEAPRDGAPPPKAVVDADVQSLFWPDGAVRVGGREYNGLVRSACFRQGTGARKLSCLSCHAMHDSDPVGQIAKGRAGDDACFSCHADKRGDAAAHTHHAPGSAGSACSGCHMPETTYALLKGIASHTIDSPVVRTEPGARPVACNLCHLDRALAWTAERLHAWYGAPPSPAADAQTASGATWLLSGDAAVRVVVAAAFGSAGARAANGTGWPAPLLARALEDPYAAVRIVATRSLNALPGYEDVRLDPEAPPEERARVRRLVEERATRAGHGGADDPALDALVARRDDHAISISE